MPHVGALVRQGGAQRLFIKGFRELGRNHNSRPKQANGNYSVNARRLDTATTPRARARGRQR